MKNKKERNPKEPDFYERTGAAKGPPPGGKDLFPGGAGGRSKKFLPRGNFKMVKEKLAATGKLDLEDFNNAEDVGLFLDWYNKGLQDKAEAAATRETLEISKLLVKLMTQKNIVINPKKGAKI